MLELEMASEAALPVAQVAKRLQIDPRHLMMQRPECAAVLCERYQMRIKQEREREGERVLKMIQAVDEWPSQRAVARDIGVSRTSQGFRDAWQ